MRNIRLTDKEVAQIASAFNGSFLPNDHLWLFGSRTDINRRGGDIDLYVETEMMDPDAIIEAKLNFLTSIQMVLGDQKIDIVVKYGDTDLPIYKIARDEGVILI